MDPATALELADWRRRVAVLYAEVRAAARTDPSEAHGLWCTGRDTLFRTHPQSPLPASDPLRETGLPVWPYDASLRWELPVGPHGTPGSRGATPGALALPTGEDGTTTLRRIGAVHVPGVGALDVWWLAQYGGGLFLPLRDGTAGSTTYGGGRYLLDTAKGADLGAGHATGAVTRDVTRDVTRGAAARDALTLVVDLNFLYHPSCRYDPAWTCPLAPAGNRTPAPVEAGERLTAADPR